MSEYQHVDQLHSDRPSERRGCNSNGGDGGSDGVVATAGTAGPRGEGASERIHEKVIFFSAVAAAVTPPAQRD